MIRSSFAGQRGIEPFSCWQAGNNHFVSRLSAAKLSTLKQPAEVKKLKLSDDELEEAYKLAKKVDAHLAAKPQSRYHGKEEELFGKLMEGKLKINSSGELVATTPAKVMAENAGKKWTWSHLPENIKTHAEFGGLSRKNKTRLAIEMHQNPSFKSAIEGNPKLIGAWKKVNFLWKFRNEPGFLESFDHVLNNKSMQHHVFEGDFGVYTSGPRAGQLYAKGMHHVSGIKRGRMRIDPETKKRGTIYSETYEAKVERRNEFTGSWLDKSNNQHMTSFFPDSWNKNQTMEEIAYAHWKILQDKTSTFHSGNRYFYRSSDGKAEINMYLASDDGIISSFPEVK